MLHRHTNGEISKEKYEVFRNVWFKKENELKSEVTALYDVAYAGGCFDYKIFSQLPPETINISCLGK